MFYHLHNQLTQNLARTVSSQVIVALDNNTQADALALADMLDPKLCRVKVGKELFTHAGVGVVKALHQRGFEVFLDLKFHDIPNTTAQAVLAAAELGVWMVNVHASVGSHAMSLAKERLVKGGYDTLLIAVTVLTSMTQTDLTDIGVYVSIDEQVKRLSLLAQNAGLDGVVCSAREALMLRQLINTEFKLVTPGIRMTEDHKDDQARICTPKEAIDQGADYLVIGRSITGADDPNAKLQQILATIG